MSVNEQGAWVVKMSFRMNKINDAFTSTSGSLRYYDMLYAAVKSVKTSLCDASFASVSRPLSYKQYKGCPQPRSHWRHVWFVQLKSNAVLML